MRILITLSRFPYPPDKGDKLRAWNQIEGLSKNHEVHVFCLSDERISKEAQEKLLALSKSIKIIYLTKSGVFFRLIKNLFSSLPFQVAYFNSSPARKAFQVYLNQVKPDLIYCQLARMAEYSRGLSQCKKMIDYQDAFSKGIERRIPHENLIKKIFFQWELNRLKKYESLIFGDYDSRFIISGQDAALIKHSSSYHFRILANGVDTDYYKPEPGPRTLELLFTGNMHYEPNVNCVLYLIQQVFPLLPDELKHIQLIAAGKDPAKALRVLKAKNLHLTGWVDDLRTYYRQANLFVAPMQIGIGMQNKILEAMAMGLPVITSSLANRAIGGEHEKNIWVADSPQKVAEAITFLLSNSELALNIGRNARQFMLENYTWSKQNELLNGFLEETSFREPLNQHQ